MHRENIFKDSKFHIFSESGWKKITAYYKRHPLTGNSFLTKTSTSRGVTKLLSVQLYKSKMFRLLNVYIRFQDFTYTIQNCNDKRNVLKNVPAALHKTWNITMSKGFIEIRCNGVNVLMFTFATVNLTKYPKCTASMRESAARFAVLSRFDTAMTSFLVDHRKI